MMNESNSEQIDWPSVSVIIVTKGHHDLAKDAVDSVLATEYPIDRRQMVVVEETNKPKPIEGRGVEYHTIPERNLGVAFARNQGVRYAQHKIIAFTDDDCLVEKRWLKEIVKPLLKSDDVAAVAGSVLLPDCGPIGQCENILGFPGGGVKFIHAAQGKTISLPTFWLGCVFGLEDHGWSERCPALSQAQKPHPSKTRRETRTHRIYPPPLGA